MDADEIRSRKIENCGSNGRHSNIFGNKWLIRNALPWANFHPRTVQRSTTNSIEMSSQIDDFFSNCIDVITVGITA